MSASCDLCPDAKQWWALIRLWGGGLFGWLLHPALWIVAGPRRWCVILATTAYAESRYTADPDIGADGELGILQFLPSTWDLLVGAGIPTVSDPYDAFSPAHQGYYAAKYFQDRILSRWALVPYMMVPYYGIAVFRHEWRHLPNEPIDITAWWTELKGEQDGKVRVAWDRWTLLSATVILTPLVLVLAWRRR